MFDKTGLNGNFETEDELLEDGELDEETQQESNDEIII